MIEPGTYTGVIVSHGISEGKNALQAWVTFGIAVGDKNQQITWYGSFSDKAQAITIKSLLVCGLKGANPAGDLEVGREVSLVIDDEEGQDGKVRTKVKWVNAIGGARNVVKQDLAKAKLESLQGAVMAARQDLGVPDPDDIPF